MTTPVPQIGADQPDVASPEALMISALLATGTFLPSEHHLSEEDLSCHTALWNFCVDYQRKTGVAPGLELVRARHPEFTFLPGLDVNWAADQLHEASYGRKVRRELGATLRALGDGDMALVTETLTGLAQPRRSRAITGVYALDGANLESIERKEGLPLPFEALAEVAEVIGFEELWTLAAFVGHGKSQMLPYYAAVIAEAGWTVNYLSIEMTAKAINRRIIRCHARGNRDLQLRLNHADHNVRGEALDELRATIPGRINTFDPSMVRMNMQAVEDATNGAHIVMIDHIGLLQLSDGRRAIEDWRTMAQISNMLKEVNLSTKTAMLNAAQTNKESNKQGMEPPHLTDIGGSIAIPQDSDVVVTQRVPVQGLMTHALRKNRENIMTKWYTRFNPGRADFREISREDAHALKLAGEDIEAAG